MAKTEDPPHLVSESKEIRIAASLDIFRSFRTSDQYSISMT